MTDDGSKQAKAVMLAHDELYPQICKLKLFREALVNLNVTEIVPCENGETERENYNTGLYQILSDVTDSYDRFAAKLLKFYDEGVICCRR